jgi:adenine-specific DNA-methyltransferase
MNVKTLGQVFTPKQVVKTLISLRKNFGTCLEPSCGNGAILRKIENCVGIEIDKDYKSENVLNIDFFEYSTENKFDTIIGNPPFVKFQNISKDTLPIINSKLLKTANLYVYFIEKCINHLKNFGELIFIVPRDFLKATSCKMLNQFIYDNGTITDYIDFGDDILFKGYSPNCIIFRFQKNNFNRVLNCGKNFYCINGQLYITDKEPISKFSDLFFVKVGALSAYNEIFEHPDGIDFVCSETFKTGKTKKMLYNVQHKHLENNKELLINRKIKKFTNDNYFTFGRNCFESDLKRIYVNCKTRHKKPFFLNDCKYFDGSVLAIFPKDQNSNLKELCNFLNSIEWDKLGFVCNGRYQFSQNSLESCQF